MHNAQIRLPNNCSRDKSHELVAELITALGLPKEAKTHQPVDRIHEGLFGNTDQFLKNFKVHFVAGDRGRQEDSLCRRIKRLNSSPDNLLDAGGYLSGSLHRLHLLAE